MGQKKQFMVVLAVVFCVGLIVSVIPSGKAHAAEIRLKVANYFPAPANQLVVESKDDNRIEVKN